MYEQIVALLQRRGVPFEMHAHVVARTVAEVEERLSFPREQWLKTIVFRLKGGGWVLAGLRAQDRVDYKKLAAGLGVGRDQLASAAPEEVEAALGYEVGGVGPLPPGADSRAVFDNRLLGLGTVYCGSGRSDRTLAIDLQDMIAAAGGTVLDIAREG